MINTLITSHLHESWPVIAPSQGPECIQLEESKEFQFTQEVNLALKTDEYFDTFFRLSQEEWRKAPTIPWYPEQNDMNKLQLQRPPYWSYELFAIIKKGINLLLGRKNK